MTASSYVPNAIAWAQLHLLGGPRKLASFAVAYLAILVAATVGFRYLDRSIALTTYCDGAVHVLSWVQSGLILLGGCNAVLRAITRDVTTKMLESHRISPVSPAAVLFGYVFGANLQVLLLYAIGMFFGSVIIRWGTIGLGNWLVGNVFMLVVAIMAWTTTVLLNIASHKPVNPTGILFVAVMLSASLFYAPGVGLLSGFYAAWVAYELMLGTLRIPPDAVAAVAVATVVMTFVWARAAMRLYRRPDLPAFGTLRAFGLVGIWLIACAVGVVLFNSLRTRSSLPWNVDDEPAVMATVSLAASLVVTLLPVSAAAHARCRIARGASSIYAGDNLPAVLVPAVCAVLLILLSAWLPGTTPQRMTDVAAALVALAASLAAVEGLYVILYARDRRPAVWVFLFITVFWGAPPLCDLWYREVAASAYPYEPLPPTLAFGFSPIGTLYELVHPSGAEPRFGSMFQILLAVALFWAASRSLRRLHPDHRTAGQS